MNWGRQGGIRLAVTAVGVVALVAAAAAGAGPGAIPKFAYTYGLTTARYSLTETANGDQYTGQGKMEGTRFPGPAGPRRLGVLVNNNLFRSGTVQGTWQVAFRLTETWQEVDSSRADAQHCRGHQVLDSPWPLTIQLSILPAAQRVIARYPIFVPLGQHGCGNWIGYRLQRQTLPLSLFTRTRFTVTLRGSAIVETSGASHSLKWSITFGVVRTGGYTLP